MTTLVNVLYQCFPCRRTNGKALISRSQFARLFYPLLTKAHKDHVWLDNVLQAQAGRLLLDDLAHNAAKNGKPLSILALKQLIAQGDVRLVFQQEAQAGHLLRVRNHRFGQQAVQDLQHAVATRKSGFVIHRVWLA